MIHWVCLLLASTRRSTDRSGSFKDREHNGSLFNSDAMTSQYFLYVIVVVRNRTCHIYDELYSRNDHQKIHSCRYSDKDHTHAHAHTQTHTHTQITYYNVTWFYRYYRIYSVASFASDVLLRPTTIEIAAKATSIHIRHVIYMEIWITSYHNNVCSAYYIVKYERHLNPLNREAKRSISDGKLNNDVILTNGVLDMSEMGAHYPTRLHTIYVRPRRGERA